jgi:hypothetical protein
MLTGVWVSLVLSGADGEQQGDAMALRPVDYLQMMSQELATFEAEYQHIVRCEEGCQGLLLKRCADWCCCTLVISWSTSPFLDPAQSRSFLQVNVAGVVGSSVNLLRLTTPLLVRSATSSPSKPIRSQQQRKPIYTDTCVQR